MSALMDTLPLASLLAHHAALKPSTVALSDESTALTWAELESRTNRVARALLAHGVQTDDLISIALPNENAFLEACFACWKAGATPQPLSSRLPRAEMEAIIALAKPSIIIARPDLEIGHPTITYFDLLAAESDDTPLPLVIASCFKAPTSGGSSGRPKLILSGEPATIDVSIASAWRLGSEDVALIPGPLYHTGPFTTAINAMAAGTKLVVQPRFDAEAVLEAIDRHKASWLCLVPTMMNRIWKLDDAVKAKYDITSLKTMWHIAAPCPAWLKQVWIDWIGAGAVWELYGATESIAGTVIDGTEWLAHRGSVGRVFSGQIKIFGDDGRELPPGETGEVFMRAAEEGQVTYRYVGAEANTRGEWHSLGDMGYFDAEGYLYLGDRRGDMILVGGSNVYPAEVEAAIEEHPDVQSCAVIGLPDDDLGARVHAIVQPRPGLPNLALQEFVAERLVRYKQPRSYEFTDAPLRDAAGKVRRSRLRSERIAAGE
ncbi:AMP-binding protein [Sphingopyxis sp. 550A]